ncbi:IclR family transcriptional regulator [Rhodococcus kronopolitis]|uniref:IclR family transcriptional regulator n=1 Tax=Rhodococcus kronopolitis TaxID=1460226 RepID=A0ABV9FQ57_9NOCA
MDDHTLAGRLLTIIDAVADLEGPASLAALTESTGIPKPTVMRVANDLAARGVLRRDPGGYRLGERLIDLGSVATRHHGMRDAAMPHLQELLARTGEVVSLAMLCGDELAELERVYGHNRADVAGRPLVRRPAADVVTTAMGRCLLAHRSDLAEAALRVPVPRRTRYTVTSPERIRDDLAAVRDRGFSLEYEQTMEGWCCVGAPILGGNGEVVASVGILGRPGARFTPHRLTRALLSAAEGIAIDWGTCPPPPNRPA